MLRFSKHRCRVTGQPGKRIFDPVTLYEKPQTSCSYLGIMPPATRARRSFWTCYP